MLCFCCVSVEFLLLSPFVSLVFRAYACSMFIFYLCMFFVYVRVFNFEFVYV